MNEEHIIGSPQFVNWATLDMAELKPSLCSLAEVKGEVYERYAIYTVCLWMCAYLCSEHDIRHVNTGRCAFKDEECLNYYMCRSTCRQVCV